MRPYHVHQPSRREHRNNTTEWLVGQWNLDDVRAYLRKAERAAALIYAHFRKEFGLPEKR